MEERELWDSRMWLRWTTAICAGVTLAVGLCIVLYKIRLVVVPFAAGFVVAYIFDPWLDKLQSRGWSRQRAVWTIMALLLSFTVLAFVLLVPQVMGQITDAWQHRSLYSVRADRYYDDLRARAERWLGRYEGYLPGGKTPSEYLDEALQQLEGAAKQHWPRVLAWLGARTLQAFGVLVLILFGILVAFHFMLIIDSLREGVERLFLSERQSQEVNEIVERVNRMLGAYVRGMAAVSILVGIATGLALGGVSLAFGTRYALVLGVLAGATYAVPWIGQTVSAGAAFFFGLVTADHHALLAAVVCGGVVIAINQVCDNVVMPRIVGAQVGLHPLVVLLAIMVG
ncbi:MAG: AI-2E family transporter, partial [Candidatus Zipacnadales bacterium]